MSKVRRLSITGSIPVCFPSKEFEAYFNDEFQSGAFWAPSSFSTPYTSPFSESIEVRLSFCISGSIPDRGSLASTMDRCNPEVH